MFVYCRRLIIGTRVPFPPPIAHRHNEFVCQKVNHHHDVTINSGNRCPWEQTNWTIACTGCNYEQNSNNKKSEKSTTKCSENCVHLFLISKIDRAQGSNLEIGNIFHWNSFLILCVRVISQPGAHTPRNHHRNLLKVQIKSAHIRSYIYIRQNVWSPHWLHSS